MFIRGVLVTLADYVEYEDCISFWTDLRGRRSLSTLSLGILRTLAEGCVETVGQSPWHLVGFPSFCPVSAAVAFTQQCIAVPDSGAGVAREALDADLIDTWVMKALLREMNWPWREIGTHTRCRPLGTWHLSLCHINFLVTFNTNLYVRKSRVLYHSCLLLGMSRVTVW